MKKTLLFGGILLSSVFAQAQQRIALYEEFSGENCAPCAALNPALMTLLGQPGNDAKIVLLKYQSPIPSAGPIYNANKVFTDNRMDYYSIPFAPHGAINGTDVGTGANQGNINQTTQAMIDAGSTGTAAFTITVGNPVYANGGQSFTSTITVKATNAATYANLKLRVALVESLHYTAAPGTNGETDFHNVVREMYGTNGANADGQSIGLTWTANQTINYTVSGSIPSYVGSNPAIPASIFLVAFVQKDDTKEVLQVGKTGNITIQKPPLDLALTNISNVSGLKCQTPTTITPTITVKNVGTTTVNNAKVYVAGNSTPQSITFTPALAAGASQDVALAAMNITTSGMQSIVDSIALPNGSTVDMNAYDNKAAGTAYILSSTPNALPLTYNFEPSNPNDANFVPWPGSTGNGYPIVKGNSGTDNLGHGGSQYLGWFQCFSLPQGVVGYMLFPKTTMPAGAKAVDFWVAYAQYTNTDNTIAGDKLELVYTTDCGQNWTSIWSKSNADLATAPNTSGGVPFRPSASTWKMFSADATTVPDGAYFAFKGTSGFGNDMFIDDINVRTGAPALAINELVAEGSFNVYPNPTSDNLNVSIDLKKASSVTYTVYNVLGQQVLAPITKSLNAGTNTNAINTNSLATGMYYLNVATEAGNIQQKFTKQ